MFCRLILCLSHIIGNILIKLRCRYMRFKDVISRRLAGERKLYKSLHKIHRLPSHVGVVILEDEISYKELSKIIVWCLSLGISYLSIYDPDGQIKSHKEKLYAQTQHLKHAIFQKVSINHKVVFISPEKVIHKVKNGHSKENCRKILVNLLCRENGRRDIAAAMKRHAICLKEESIPSEQKQTDLSYYLKGNADFPDPDLLLQFGPVHTTVGYLPWHIRLTEMHSFHTHHGIELSDFFNVLDRYSNCEQRFGK